MNISGYAAFTEKGELQPYSYKRKTIEPHEVGIAVECCGICHSDIHLIDNDWKASSYPFIPGHEAIGKIVSVGEQVKNLKVGDRVGVGWQAGSCHTCEWCSVGEENLCVKNSATCVGRNGGYADGLVVDSQFAIPIPNGLTSEAAAPLMCAGITVFSPLRRLNVGKGTKVGVVGIGGLGHLALQFARAMGAEVTAFSNSENKKTEAEKFGAHNFVATSKKEQMREVKGSIDVFLSTVSVDLDWRTIFPMLRPNGRLVILGASPSDIPVPPFELIGQQKGIVGSCIGGIPMLHDMLQFAADHNVAPKIEVLPLAQVNEAIARVRSNQVRYRMVLRCG